MNAKFTIEHFREALIEFCKACIDLKSNEKAFQAYYAYFIIKKMNEVNKSQDCLKYVHREGHLDNSRLKELISNRSDCQIANNIGQDYFNNVKPWQLYPDLSISHIPIDNRHSKTRGFNISSLVNLTNNVGDWLITQNIISEFKATGSVIDHMQSNHIIKDISKLAVLASAHKNVYDILKIELEKINLDFSPGMQTCMVILDNYNNEPIYASDEKRMYNGVLRMKDHWPKGITSPFIFVLLKWDGQAKVDTYIDWKLTDWKSFISQNKI